MGINGLWDVIGTGETHRIEDYAAAHFEKHKRPLRIAVDEACWRFNNLTDEQVQRIQEGEPAANPIEKVILWRILRFWRLNIQLLFVTDGLQKIRKDRWASKGAGPRGGRIDPKCIKMLHQMFDRLKVPYHAAPGEAEAECARLQQLGVVDAVWSDDSDCLMFGCTKLIKAYKNNSGKKEWLDRITVYDAETILPKYDLDTDSLVMFAVLAGGDYDTKGLPGCGYQTARSLCQRKMGLAGHLIACTTNAQLMQWRDLLAMTLATKKSSIGVPPDFPSLKALNGYRGPSVSTDEQRNNLRRLNGGWEWQENRMDQAALQIVLRNHYNFKTKEWMHHMAPVFLTRMLTRDVTPARREENLLYDIQLRRTLKRKSTSGDDNGTRSEVNILFNAARLVNIDLSSQDSINADGSPYDPIEPVKGVMLKCFLEYGLPEGALDKPTPSPKKKGKKMDRSTDVVDVDDDDDDLPTPRATRDVPTSTQQSSKAEKPRKRGRATKEVTDETDIAQPRSPKAAKQRARTNDDEAGPSEPVRKRRKPKAPVKARTPSPLPATFRRVEMPDFSGLRRRACEVIDLDDDDFDDNAGSSKPSPSVSISPYGEPLALQEPAELGRGRYPRSLQQRHDLPISRDSPEMPFPSTISASRRSRPPAHATPVAEPEITSMSSIRNTQPSAARIHTATTSDLLLEGLVPGEVATAAILRQRRELGLLSKLPMRSREVVTSSKNHAQQLQREVIDLT